MYILLCNVHMIFAILHKDNDVSVAFSSTVRSEIPFSATGISDSLLVQLVDQTHS